MPPDISTSAHSLSPAGNYLILVSVAVSANYTITYVDGVLTVEAYQQPMIPNTFTPNGDGVNDQWDIKPLLAYLNCTVQMFNRAGQ